MKTIATGTSPAAKKTSVPRMPINENGIAIQPSGTGLAPM